MTGRLAARIRALELLAPRKAPNGKGYYTPDGDYVEQGDTSYEDLISTARLEAEKDDRAREHMTGDQEIDSFERELDHLYKRLPELREADYDPQTTLLSGKQYYAMKDFSLFLCETRIAQTKREIEELEKEENEQVETT